MKSPERQRAPVSDLPLIYTLLLFWRAQGNTHGSLSHLSLAASLLWKIDEAGPWLRGNWKLYLLSPSLTLLHHTGSTHLHVPAFSELMGQVIRSHQEVKALWISQTPPWVFNGGQGDQCLLATIAIFYLHSWRQGASEGLYSS